MTDREKIDWMSDKLGALRKRTKKYSYIGPRRFTFDGAGNIIEIRIISGDGRKWMPCGDDL